MRLPHFSSCLPRRILVLGSGAAIGLGLFASPALPKKTKIPPCPGGRFIVRGASVIGDTAVVIDGKKLSIGNVCPPVFAKLKGSRRGTKVKATWPACTALRGKVRLEATIEPGCSLMNATLVARRAMVRETLTARRSECGDGIVDREGGEQCESDAECVPGQRCTEACACFEGAQASDYVMFGGMETEGDSNCTAVSSPVRTGLRACQIDQGFFSQLRPNGFSHDTIYVRVYHRIDVTTPPTSEAFAAVIVTDVLPRGISAVDVGINTDGTLRYRLRNRLTATNLGLSGSVPSGQWIELELRTTIGAGTGSAELRINGSTAITATNQDFGSSPLDTVFISNNPDPYGGASGGVWSGTFDDIAMTINQFPGAGRVITRQGRSGTPTYNQWTVVGDSTIDRAWSETPSSQNGRAETPPSGDPLAQTMLVAPFDQGVDSIGAHSTIKVCQTWLNVGLLGTTADRTYAIRRRVGGLDTDVTIAALTPSDQYRSDGLDGAFWTASRDDLNAAEIGAVKSGGSGGTGLRVEDAWLECEYQ